PESDPPPLAYLLDGDNLIGSERGRAASEEDRAALVREVSDRLRRTRARVVLFFHAAGRSLVLGALSVEFAGNVSADDAILRAGGGSAPRDRAAKAAPRTGGTPGNARSRRREGKCHRE